ncbi:MAG: lysozyme inhibitor LprI family protein [Methylotenera sp.]
MRSYLLFLLALIAIPLGAFAEVECSDGPECWPEGSAMHSGLLLVEKQKTLAAKLVNTHEELVNLVSSAATPEKVWIDERLLKALKTQQAAWVKYRSEECELIGSLTGAGGTWPSTYANRCEVNHTELRLRRVRSAIKCIEKIPEEKRWYEQNNCLQQLAPLTNK